MWRPSAGKPIPEGESDNPDQEQWLGAEAHVRFQEKRPGWREALLREAFLGNGPGVAGLTLAAAFVMGLLMGGGAIMLCRPRRRTNRYMRIQQDREREGVRQARRMDHG